MTPLQFLLEWDAAARAWLSTHHHPIADAVMIGASLIGRAGAIWLIVTLALFLLDRRRGRAALRVVVALALAYGVTDGLVKPVVARARPFDASAATRVIDTRPSTYSFPSGHTAASIAAAITMSAMWPPGRAALWTLAVLVSFSRVYVGVHYPLDIAGGALVGVVCAWAARRIIQAEVRPFPAGSG